MMGVELVYLLSEGVAQQCGQFFHAFAAEVVQGGAVLFRSDVDDFLN